MKTGVRTEKVGSASGDELIELGRHLMGVIIDCILDVVALPRHGGIAVDALLLVEETVGTLNAFAGDHTARN